MLASVQISPIQCRFSVKKSSSKMADLSVWTQRHLSRVTDDFEAADKDKSGTLTFPEVCDVLKTAGFKGSEEQAKVRAGVITWLSVCVSLPQRGSGRIL